MYCPRFGESAQMVERSLSMREVPGSMPGFSKHNPVFLLSFPNCLYSGASAREARQRSTMGKKNW